MLQRAHKTDGRMLPQSCPLEVQGADRPRVPARNALGQTAVLQPSRGETAGQASLAASPAKAGSGVSRVFVLARDGQPLMPCPPGRARVLLKKGRARVAKMYPFTIRIVDRAEGEAQPVRLKLDPGSKTTGLALVREIPGGQDQAVLHLSEVAHRGATVKKHMTQRSAYRRSRRTRNLRYREPRFDNRTRPKGWLPPSLVSRLDNCLSWTRKYMRLCPVQAISVERVRFDMQLMENPEISGVEYQQGTLAGYEVREYLLEKWGRRCSYCDTPNVPLEVEHIHPKGRGGSNRVSNLTLACRECNEKKDDRYIQDFLADDQSRLARILSQLKKPLHDAAAVNATRNAIFFGLRNFGLPVEASTGGRTKFNRCRQDIPKSHCLDAACVGAVGNLLGWNQPFLHIKAMGRGSYQRTRLTADGFPRGYLTRQKAVHGFQTGDMVVAVVLKGKKAGTHKGRVAVRESGSFNIQTKAGVVQGVSWKCCRVTQRQDGYSYNHCPKGNGAPPSSEEEGIRTGIIV